MRLLILKDVARSRRWVRDYDRAVRLEMPTLRAPTAPLPREAYFEVTNRCNLLCETCPRTFLELEPPADLTYERMVEVADQLPRLERIVLHGVGEPLLNGELPRMIAYGAARGARVVFNTNGVLLDERRGDAVTGAGLAELRVSLDAATPETYARVRGADVLPRILANVEAFTARRARQGEARPEVTVWATVLRETLDELPDLVRVAGAVGARGVHLQRLVFNGIGMAVAEQSVYRDLSARQERVLAACREAAATAGVTITGSGGTEGEGALWGEGREGAWLSCRRPWKVLYVTAHGTVLPCCIAPFATTDMRQIALGDVLGDGVAAVWNGPAMRAFRARHQSADPPAPCAPCGSEWSL
jgi:MoaA/NifB/PqqE/SkfB family radical SAM enzyme